MITGARTVKKMLFVVNPYAGQRKCCRHLAQILEVFNRADWEVIAYMTAGEGDAHRVVNQYAHQVELIVCCGGDGTFNETVAGIMESGADVPVGYIPAGSTNDFANSLKLSLDPVKAAQDIVQGQPEKIDLGSFGGRCFSYVASFGAFTRASYATPQSVKNALGHAAYILGGIQELSQLKPHRLRFTLPDGKVLEDDYLFGAISNSTSVGGILTLSPDKVDMTDGMFELLLIRAPKDLAELAECIVALQRQTYNCAMMTFLSTHQVQVTAPADMDWTLDGEHERGHGHVEVVNLHHALQIVRRRKKA